MAQEKNTRRRTECKEVNGELVCRRMERSKDGSDVEVAKMSKRMDGECKPVTTSMEGEDKALGELSSFMDNNIKISCPKNKPSDY